MQLLEYEVCRDLERTHVCGVCGAPLVTVWVGLENSYAIKCGEDASHEGFQRMMSYTEMRKTGLKLPLDIEQQFQRKEAAMLEEKQEKGKDPLAGLVPLKDAGSRSDLSLMQADMLVAVAKRLELDPYMGHVVLYFGKPYVTEAGLLFYAHRSGEFDGMSSRPLNFNERKDAQIPDDEIAWMAEVHRKGCDWAFLGLGRARADASRPIAKGSAVEPLHPQRMAEKRAEMQALRKAFPIGLPVLEEGEEEG